MSGRLRWLLVGIGLILAVWALRATVFAPRPLEVETAVAARGLVEDTVTNSQAGTVKARFRARVGAERAGRVASIPVREGAAVRRGQQLIELNAETARRQLDLAQRELEALRATLDGARAAATLARQEHARTEELKRQGLVSQEAVDQARSRLDGAESELRASEARVERARAAVGLGRDELAHLRVLAPFDGVIADVLVELGESVIPGQGVVELVSLDRLYVSAPIDELDIGRIREGLPARVSLDPYPNARWMGRVTRVAPVVSDLKEQNRTLDVEVEIPPAPDLPRPKPGTSADVEIILSRREGVVRIPTFAVIEGRRVLTVAGGKAVSRDVTPGLKNWEWTEIERGLSAGERVITNLDKQGLRAGVRVVARDAAAPGRAGSAEADGR